MGFIVYTAISILFNLVPRYTQTHASLDLMCLWFSWLLKAKSIQIYFETLT